MDYAVFNCSTLYLGNLVLDYSFWSFFLCRVFGFFFNLGKQFIPEVNCVKYLICSSEY